MYRLISRPTLEAFRSWVANAKDLPKPSPAGAFDAMPPALARLERELGSKNFKRLKTILGQDDSPSTLEADRIAEQKKAMANGNNAETGERAEHINRRQAFEDVDGGAGITPAIMSALHTFLADKISDEDLTEFDKLIEQLCSTPDAAQDEPPEFEGMPVPGGSHIENGEPVGSPAQIEAARKIRAAQPKPGAQDARSETLRALARVGVADFSFGSSDSQQGQPANYKEERFTRFLQSRGLSFDEAASALRIRRSRPLATDAAPIKVESFEERNGFVKCGISW